MRASAIILVAVACAVSCTTPEKPQQPESRFEGLRTVIYVVPDLNAAKQWYQDAFAIKPYFDQPFYVGFDVNGFELGLDPDTSIIKPGQGGSVVYWKVDDIQTVHDHMVTIGAQPLSPVENVGVLTATVIDPFGNIIGLIEEQTPQP